jgi:hypothetical protein
LRRYLLWVFILSLPFWLVGGLVETQALPLNLPVSALMAFNPLIVALALTFREQGGKTVLDLLRRVLDYPRIRDKRWVLPIFLLMPLLMVLTYGLMRLSGRDLPAAQMSAWLALPLFAVFFLTAIGEELGWQGYAYPILQRRWNALQAGIFLGVVWAVWHIIPYMQMQHSTAWVLWQGVATVGLRVLIVWMYANTGESLFAAIAFHVSINVSNFLFPNYGSHYDPFYASLVILATVAGVVRVWGARTLACESLRRRI